MIICCMSPKLDFHRNYLIGRKELNINIKIYILLWNTICSNIKYIIKYIQVYKNHTVKSVENHVKDIICDGVI